MTLSAIPDLRAWPGSRPLLTDPTAPELDLDSRLGQVVASYRFALIDSVSGLHLGDIHPIRTAALRHDTSQTIKRELSLSLGKSDTAAINALTDRVSVLMSFPTLGEFPLGTYMFVDDPRRLSTGGRTSQPRLMDEMFLVDQEITAGISGVGNGVIAVIQDVLAGQPITYRTEATPYISADSWAAGAQRGAMLETLSVSGDYWSPWFDNLGVLRFRRTFNPASSVVDIDLDVGARVIRDSIVETSELLTAPNTFVVISNSATDPSAPVVGTATVPVNAPNSVPNRGFAITSVVNLQLSDTGQATAVARGLVERQSIFEQVTLSTAPDPRHDSYNVIRWQGSNWLELRWSMVLREGEPMTHTMRKSYG